MMIVQPPEYLTWDDLQERVARFLAGPHTIDFAADYGLLALAVEARFGGFLIDMNARIHLLYRRYGQTLYPIWVHNRVCDVIYKHGTTAQYDLYLPQLAAGKRLGAWTYSRYDSHNHSTIRADRHSEGFSFRGDTVVNTRLNARTLVLIAALLEGQIREFIVNGDTLSEQHVSNRGRVLIQLRGYVAPRSSLLGLLEPSEIPTEEKWEAIRWRTDRSAS